VEVPVIEAAVALLTAPFPLFLIVLVVGMVVLTDRIERRDP
jgi:hypothetical protein